MSGEFLLEEEEEERDEAKGSSSSAVRSISSIGGLPPTGITSMLEGGSCSGSGPVRDTDEPEIDSASETSNPTRPERKRRREESDEEVEDPV